MFNAAFPLRSFYMIRHGESVANAEGFAAGILDVPLTSKGRAQAEAARLCLEALPHKPTRIVHSALQRARETACIVNRTLRLPMQEEPKIGERAFGAWVRAPWDFVGAALDAGQDPPQGESLAAFDKRVVPALSAALAATDDLILFATHGGVFHAFVRAFDLNMEDPDNCAFYGFEATPRSIAFPWRVWRYAYDEKTQTATRCAVPVARGLGPRRERL